MQMGGFRPPYHVTILVPMDLLVQNRLHLAVNGGSPFGCGDLAAENLGDIDVLEVFQVLGLSRLVGGNVNAFLGLDGVAYITGDELK